MFEGGYYSFPSDCWEKDKSKLTAHSVGEADQIFTSSESCHLISELHRKILFLFLSVLR
jgi:hypothetical protein